MSKDNLIRAVNLAGGQVALAAGIRARMPGCKAGQGLVWKWINQTQSNVPPADYVLAICDTVGWKVTPHELRPDIYPNKLDAMPDAICGRYCEQKKAA